MIWWIVILAGVYAMLMLLLMLGWSKKKPLLSTSNKNPLLKISVIIPVRNEAENIPTLLADLEKQTYQNFEVIVVNDHSTDKTEDEVRMLMKNTSMSLQLLSLGEVAAAHKKKALQLGVQYSTGELIVTTDGDCRVGREWLKTLADFQQKYDLAAISGPVRYEDGNTIFKQLQEIEFASLIGVGGASMQLGYPNMCNGANFAFLKQVYQDTGGYDDMLHIASGDDELLMHKIYKAFPDRVKFLKDSSAVVVTASNGTWKEFSAQRTRWSTKWKHYKLPYIKVLAIFLFLFNLSLMIVTILSCVKGKGVFVVLSIWLVKLILDFLFIGSVLRLGKQKLRPHLFLLIEVFHIIYVIIFGLKAQSKRYSWKGRSVR